jgi:glycolate oxidase FAD binding subunit
LIEIPMPHTPIIAGSLAPAGAALGPASAEELADVIADARARGQALFCEGNGSKRHHGPAVTERARRISLRRLDRVTAYDAGDMVVSCQAGVRLVDLQRTLAEHRQWLPIDPPYPGATIGGILASASAGPRRHGYGTIKDALLGLAVVGADGAVTKSGGKVVKNVSGFDLHRMQVGAFGTLGILLEAHLKVQTRPALVGALLLGHDDFAASLRTLLGIAATPLRPVALEAIDAGAAAPLRGLCPELPDTAAVAIVGIEGSRAAFDRHLRDLAPLRSATRISTVLEGGAAERLWQAFRDGAARTTDDITVRLGVRPHDLPALLEGLDLEALGVVGRACHAGQGIARLRLRRPSALAALGVQLRDLQMQARAQQGYAIVEAAPLGIAGRETLPFGNPPSDLARKLKEAWDPTAIFNPGRVTT